MKSTRPHDPLDDLIAAALHGDLTPQERTQFDAHLSNDPAAQAAYRKAQHMHDLLEKTHKSAQPDDSFEQRMVSGVRRKLQHEQHRETSWESLLVLWTMVKRFMPRRYVTQYGIMLAFVSVVSLSVLIHSGNQVKGVFTTISSQLAYAGSAGDSEDQKEHLFTRLPQQTSAKDEAGRYVETAQKGVALSGYVDKSYTTSFSDQTNAGEYTKRLGGAERGAAATRGGNTYRGGTSVNGSGTLAVGGLATMAPNDAPASPSAPAQPTSATAPPPINEVTLATHLPSVTPSNKPATLLSSNSQAKRADLRDLDALEKTKTSKMRQTEQVTLALATDAQAKADKSESKLAASTTATETEAVDTRKLIRNAQLDLEVKSYQGAVDQITLLTKAAGGYVDTSSSQKGGNGKLQGTVVVKVLPQNLDAFLLKLRDLGELRNQSVSTDDVTKAYFDTTARLENSRKMEIQLQELLKRNNGKVSELLQVERELGRVRGEIEQMQGQLKLYDFQVQFATITIQMREKDLNQAAAYLLKEQDQFALFASDVEGTFQQARHTADDFKAQILAANLNHESGSNVSADLTIMVAPDQIEAFLGKLRGLGRVANFTRQTQRVAKDGGDSDQPADQTLTEKDKVQVSISIRSDDESRKQVALTVVTPTVDTALDQAKSAALTNAGAEILSSSLNKTPQGQSSGQLSVRVPGKNYHALLDAYKALGRTASFSLQRDDNSGPGASDDEAPVIVSLALTDTDSPLQVTEMSVLATEVDSQAQQLKKDAASVGVQVTGSNFTREPNGMEVAQMTFRLPMSKYPTFVESLKKLGHVELFTVRRDDRPDQTRPDDSAPVEIGLRLHSQGDIVTSNNGLWATLRQTFGEGAGALFGSVRVIGVLIAFMVPWAIALGLAAWIGRRIYIWKKK